jgi:hypothetical protein
MNDPIKVRQPGGVLEFVQRENGDYISDRDGYHYLIFIESFSGFRSLMVRDSNGTQRAQASDPAGETAPPTTLFAIAETIHARLTGRDQDARAESVNAELLEALKGFLSLESVPADYGYVTFDDEDFHDAFVKAELAIARAEAQQ